MTETSQQTHQKKKQAAPAYTQRQAEERLAHYKEIISEMKHPNEMETVLSITKDIAESGFNVTEIHQMLAERAMVFVLKSLEEISLHFVEEFLHIVKKTIANVQTQLNQASEMAYAIARNKLEEGDVGLVRRYYQVGKLASDDKRYLEEQLETRLMELADERLNDDTVELVDNYISIAKTITIDLTPARQKMTEKALRLAERTLDQNKYDLTESYVGLAAVAGGDVTVSQEYLAKKSLALIEKEMQVPIKERNIKVAWQLIRIVSSVGGDSGEFETKLVADINGLESAKRRFQIIRALVVVAIIGGLFYGLLWWREQSKLEKIKAEKVENDKRTQIWEQRLSAATFGDILYSLSKHSEGITDVALSANEQYFVTVGNDHKTYVWRLNDGTLDSLYVNIDNPSVILTVSISSDNQYVFAGGNEIVTVTELLTGKLVRTIDAHTDFVTTSAVTNDNTYYISGSGDKSIHAWNISDGTEAKNFDGHTGMVNALSITSDNKILVSTSDDSTIRLWNISEEKEFSRLYGNDIMKSVSVSSEGNCIASGTPHGKILLWKLSDGTMLQTIDAGSASINTLSFANQGKEIIAGTDAGEISVWNVSDGKNLRRLQLHNGSITSFVVHSKNSFIISVGGNDNLIKVIKFY
ncbi:MAG: WD40 repeat domain-containing protein [Ignavibacteria bacterium]|nr:WD40 repeat domain-containing protein [Ignavibacteria bacterium]